MNSPLLHHIRPQTQSKWIATFFFFFLDCNLLRDLVAMAFRLNVPGFLIHGDSLVAQMVESACNAGDLSSVPESGRSPGEGNGNPLQYSCLENPIARGAW